MWVYEREAAPDDVFVTLRIPKPLWDRYEYRHRHFGAAIHSLRLTVVDLLAAHALTRRPFHDAPDPFYRETP